MPEESEKREQEIKEISARIFAGIWEKRMTVIRKDYAVNQIKHDQEIISIIENLLLKWKSLYDGQTRALMYVIISPLSSGAITRRYEFQIALFDQNLYLEENPLCVYWKPGFIFKDIEEDMDAYKQMAAKEIIRLREDEVYEMRRRYALCHAYITMFYMDGIVRKVYELPIWREVAKEDAKVMYGTYMEQMVELGTVREEGGK